LGFARFSWIVESGAFAVAFGGAEEEPLFRSLGKADETGLAIGIGSDREV